MAKTYCNSEVKCLVDMSFLKEISQKSFVFELQSFIFEASLAEKLSFWASKFHFWRKSRRKASFLSFKTSILKEVSQKSFVFDLQSFNCEGSLAEKLRFWASKFQFWRKSRRKASFLSFSASFLSFSASATALISSTYLLPTQLRHCRSIQVEKYFAPATRRPGGSQKSFALEIMNHKWQQLRASFKSYGFKGLKADMEKGSMWTAILMSSQNDNFAEMEKGSMWTASVVKRELWKREWRRVPCEQQLVMLWQIRRSFGCCFGPIDIQVNLIHLWQVQVNKYKFNSFEADINWLSNHLNSARPFPIGSLSLETSATALCGRYVINPGDTFGKNQKNGRTFYAPRCSTSELSKYHGVFFGPNSGVSMQSDLAKSLASCKHGVSIYIGLYRFQFNNEAAVLAKACRDNAIQAWWNFGHSATHEWLKNQNTVFRGSFSSSVANH